MREREFKKSRKENLRGGVRRAQKKGGGVKRKSHLKRKEKSERREREMIKTRDILANRAGGLEEVGAILKRET